MPYLTKLATGTNAPITISLFSVEVGEESFTERTTNRDRALQALVQLRNKGYDARLRTDLYRLDDSTLS